jgi:hypothetical protein
MITHTIPEKLRRRSPPLKAVGPTVEKSLFSSRTGFPEHVI